jgi:hypothetical protein
MESVDSVGIALTATHIAVRPYRRWICLSQGSTKPDRGTAGGANLVTHRPDSGTHWGGFVGPRPVHSTAMRERRTTAFIESLG